MRWVPVLIAVIALVAALSLPAAAQNYQTLFQIRYWGTNYNFGNPGPPTASNAGSAWGATLRFDQTNGPWSFSARYDGINATISAWPWTSASLWDVNAHYRFGVNPSTYVGLFVGYGGLSVNSSTTPSQNGTANGFRLGAEFMNRQPSGLYFTGDISYGPSWSTNLVGFPGTGSGNVWDGRAAVGYEFMGGWGVEVGYRQVSWRIPTSSPGCPTSPGCETRWNGVTAALTFRR
jgi:hypothetical protein